MTKENQRYSADFESLTSVHATEPAMRWLIPVALDGDTMTYGQLKRRLEQEAGFATIFSAHVGHVAGALMNLIKKTEPNAPLINALVVNQDDGQPSDGVGSYMADRFHIRELAEEGAKKGDPDLWKATFERAAAEVYRYSAEEWAALYQRVFGKPLAPVKIARDRLERKEGTEKDGLKYNERNYGKGGEGPEHKALREWVTANPGAIRKAFASARTETEADLYSGDRVDVIYYCEDRTVVLEVKSRISNEIDLRRGVYQCVKYRAVKAAMDVRNEPVVDAFLVTETEVSGEIKALLRLHNIKHFIAPKDRK